MIAVLGCGGDGPTAPPPVTPTMSASLGDGATATVAQVTPQSPSVVITDSHGKHRSGITVTFTPDSGSGSVANTSATTDTAGVASAGPWTLGTGAGTQQLVASTTVDGTTLTTKFTATATADRPAAITVVSGGAQDGPFGASLATPMMVKVADRYGNPNSNVLVRFSVDSGSIIGGTTPTSTAGVTSVRVRLPRTTGPAIVTAAVDSGPTMQSTFTSRGIRFASFALYANTACGLSTEGYPYCWGDNGASQLVPVTGASTPSQVTTPQPLNGDYDFSSISLGNEGGCAVRTDGTALCWGGNMYGVNGNGGASLSTEPVAPVSGNLAFAELSRGGAATCGTTKTGQSYCWGGGHFGEIGAAGYYNGSVNQPVAVDGGIVFHSFAADGMHTCALDPNGQAYCWGSNLNGQLGVATAGRACDEVVYSTTPSGTTITTIHTTCAPSPVAVNTSVRFASLSVAQGATCGLTSTGDVYCWGDNTLGGLATGDTVSSASPAKVANLPPIKELHGADRLICGLTSSGDIYCWGLGIIAIGATPTGTCGGVSDCTTSPLKLPTTIKFTTIAVTSGDICGLSGGMAYCWGYNYNGALGIGSTSPSYIDMPRLVSGQTP